MLDKLPVELLRQVAQFLTPAGVASLERLNKDFQKVVEDNCWQAVHYGRDLVTHLPCDKTPAGWRRVVREKCLLQSPVTPFFTGRLLEAQVLLGLGRNVQAIATVQPLPLDPADALAHTLLLGRALSYAGRPQEAAPFIKRAVVQTQLKRAIAAGDAALVQCALTQGARVTTEEMNVALNAEPCDALCIEALAQTVAQRGQWNAHGTAPIQEALRLQRADVLDVLLQAGAPRPVSFLCHAARINEAEGCLKVALRHGAHSECDLGNALLSVCRGVNVNKLERARMLLDAGADAEAKAIEYPTFRTDWFFSYNDAGSIFLRTVLNGRSDQPLHDLLALLIERGAKPTSLGNRKMTALHALMLRPPQDAAACMDLLLRHGVDINARTDSGATALAILMSDKLGSNTLELAQKFVANGADVELSAVGETCQHLVRRGDSSWTPLRLATRLGEYALYEAVLHPNEHAATP